jgi:hypothetical protein
MGMQPEQHDETWQPPSVTTADTTTYQPGLQPTAVNQTPQRQTQTSEVSPVPLASSTPEMQTVSFTESPNEVVPSSESSASDDEVLVRWQAAEEIDHQRGTVWYLVFAGVTLLLIGAALFLRSWSFAVLVPVMAIALFLYTRRPPTIVNYTLSRKGLHMNDRLYLFDSFREFGVITENNQNSVFLIPRRRFQPGVSVYFPEEVGESIVDMLAARLPMREMKLDALDRLIHKLRI